MEDDIWWEKEDDLYREGIKEEISKDRGLGGKTQVSCIQEIQAPDKTVLTAVVEEECETPPTTPGRAAVESPLPLGVRNMVMDNVVPSEEGSRAACITPVKKNSQIAEDITLGKNRRQDVTVNGISLMDIMRKKSVIPKQKTPVRKEDKKTKKEKIATPPPSSSDIRNYMMKRNISDKKKTFSDISIHSKSVKERIVKYQELSNNKNDECVRSGGRCHTHSCVLIREIVEKKRSTLDKTGKIVWLMGEVTILRCPSALPLNTDHQTASVNSGDIQENISTTNKKFRSDGEDQSVTQTQWEGSNTTQYWTTQ